MNENQIYPILEHAVRKTMTLGSYDEKAAQRDEMPNGQRSYENAKQNLENSNGQTKM